MMIPIEFLNKYNIVKEDFDGENDFLETFLIATDHIPNKIIEAQILREEAKDYTEILLLRKKQEKL